MKNKRLIDANALKIAFKMRELEDDEMYGVHIAECFQGQEANLIVDQAPTVDAVEVVRCRDCHKGRPIDKTKCPEKYFKDDCIVCECEEVVGDESMIYKPTHFCSCGERKDNERKVD